MPTRKQSTKNGRKPTATRKEARPANSPKVSTPAAPASTEGKQPTPRTGHLSPVAVDLTCANLEPPPADWNEHERRLKARVEQLEQLGFDATWPSVFLPLRTDVRELLGRVRRSLEGHGFQVADVPDGLLNPLGDGKTWVVRCMPTAKISPGQDAADLAWRCLESEGVKVVARPTWDSTSLLIPLGEASAQTKDSSAIQRQRMSDSGTAKSKPLAEQDFAERVNLKLNNIAVYPYMNAREVMHATGLSRSKVYEHPGLEPYLTGSKKRLWYTRSVLNLLEPDEE